MRERVSRRAALARAAALPVLALLPARGRAQQASDRPADSLVGRLTEPWQAGKPRERVTDRENDPLIVGIEEKLRCTCGCNLSVYTCRTTDFTCETSPAMHRQVVSLADEGKTADQILQIFMSQHGESVLMAPPRRGFNLAAYWVPGTVIVAAGLVLVRALARRSRAALASDAGGPDAPALAPDAAARLRAELERLEL
ncbi:MAG TPA: cytochrome c-type biogenesis protein CcmH [Gemmatimonadales bacterium]|nr:cytochrome c-type biogenesis protein CcmH [Gemmatimonadales bacterium]